MSKHVLMGIIGYLALTFSPAGRAQILEQKLSFHDVHELWKQSQAPVETLAAVYKRSLIDFNIQAAEPHPGTGQRPTPTSVLTGILTGQTDEGSSSGPAAGTTYLFYSYRLPGETQILLNNRQVKLQNFLSQAADYDSSGEGAPQEPLNSVIARVADQRDKLTEFKLSSYLELYYINLIRSAQGASLNAKCRYLQEAERMQTTLRADPNGQGAINIKEYFSGRPYQDLAQYYDAVATRYANYVAEKLACRARPPSSKNDLQKKLHEKISESLENLVSTQIVDTQLKKIEDIISSYDSVLQGISIDAKSKELLELERNLANAQANAELVSGDKLKIAGDVQALRELDRSKIESVADFGSGQAQPKLSHPSIDTVFAARKTMVAYVKAFLKNFEEAHAHFKFQASPLAQCKNIALTYEELMAPFLSEDNKKVIRSLDQAKVQAFQVQYRTCLTQIRDFIVASSKRTTFDEYLETFAKHLKELSEKVIITRNSPTGF